jgi:P-type Mg2+ transporter
MDNRTLAFWDIPRERLLSELKTSAQGLATAEVQQRLSSYGPNSLARESRFHVLLEFLRFFLNPLVLILLGASGVSFFMGDRIDALIVIVIVLLSVLVNFYQAFQAQHAVNELRKQVASLSTVLRDGKEQELPTAQLVPGDVIILNAGDLVPADARILEAKDLHVREAALTGESLPVEKRAADLETGEHGISDATNSVFMGTAVQTGIATAVVVHTGSSTAFGAIAARLAQRAPETEFDRGIKSFGMLITRVIFLLVLFVFLVNIAFHRSLFSAFLFAVALAVGLTPELLPVIISVTLAQGARRMAKKKVIVKQLASIENFGSIEILCSDKTGTLTEGEIVLDRHVDAQGQQSERTLQLVYVNSYFEAGIKSPMDDAVLKHEHPAIGDYTKLDEIPFDFTRQCLSVVVQHDEHCLVITKGAVESVLEICTQVESEGQTRALETSQREVVSKVYQQLSADGYRVLGVAVRKVEKQQTYAIADEREMTLVGFAAFLDPPKAGIRETLDALARDGISFVIMTGDNQYVTQKVVRDVGLTCDRMIVGSEVDKMTDAALAVAAEGGAVFARVSPEQKNRVILALKARGRVVAYMGDGINDAPSLHTADIGISVVNGVDVAKEAAKIILLEKDLAVLHDGVMEGRKSFANILKYIIMGTSSNFGNMFSMAAASLFLPFLPMLPTQILLNNLLYDTSQLGIPSDNVDPAMLRRPRRWQVDFIRRFMLIIGPVSSIYDFFTFGILLWVFHAGEKLFHTGWFVESLATQTLVVFVIRTAGNPLKSRPSRQLLLTVLVIVLIGVVAPYTRLGVWFGFTPMSAKLLGVLALLTVTYLLLVQVIKTRFYRRYQLGE